MLFSEQYHLSTSYFFKSDSLDPIVTILCLIVIVLTESRYLSFTDTLTALTDDLVDQVAMVKAVNQ